MNCTRTKLDYCLVLPEGCRNVHITVTDVQERNENKIIGEFSFVLLCFIVHILCGISIFEGNGCQSIKFDLFSSSDTS
jgi:hypothetical protein